MKKAPIVDNMRLE